MTFRNSEPDADRWLDDGGFDPVDHLAAYAYACQEGWGDEYLLAQDEDELPPALFSALCAIRQRRRTA